MSFHAPRNFKPSVGLLAYEFPEPWLRISRVEAERGRVIFAEGIDLPYEPFPASRCPLRVSTDASTFRLSRIWVGGPAGARSGSYRSAGWLYVRYPKHTTTLGDFGQRAHTADVERRSRRDPTSARFLRAQLDGQRDYEPVVAALEDVLVEPPRLGELHGVLEHLRRVRLEDQLLAPAEGGIIEVALERRWDVSFPQAQILVRVPLQGLLGPLERSEEPTESPSADRRRHPKRDHELALRQLAQPFGFRDRDLGVEEVSDLDLAIQERNQTLPRPAGMRRLDVLLRQHLAQGLQGREVATGHLPDAHGHVPELVEPTDLGAGPYEDGVTSHAVEVGHDPTHTGARVASGAPLAGRVSDLLLSDEGEILRALAVLVALMAGDRVHDVGEHAWLEALVPEVAFLQRDPLVQAREVRHYVDGSWFIARSTHVSITSLSPPLYLFESTRP